MSRSNKNSRTLRNPKVVKVYHKTIKPTATLTKPSLTYTKSLPIPIVPVNNALPYNTTIPLRVPVSQWRNSGVRLISPANLMKMKLKPTGTSTIFRPTTNWSPNNVLYGNVFQSLPAMKKPDEQIHGKPKASLWDAYKIRILDAIKTRKIFMIHSRHRILRQELLLRGWIEKLPYSRFNKLQHADDETLLKYARKGNDYEAAALSRLLRSYPAFFVWQDKYHPELFQDVRPYRNVIRRQPQMDFTTKVGLYGCASQAAWYIKDELNNLSIPRFYKMQNNSDDHAAFYFDYKITQCIGLMNYLKDRINQTVWIHSNENGTIPSWIVSYCLNQLKSFVADIENKFLDSKLSFDPGSIEWTQFYQLSNDLMQKKGLLKGSIKEIVHLVRSSEPYLKKIYEKYPERRWDGYRNLWILKPGFQSRGNGIVIRKSIDHILAFHHQHINRRYIIQKYIERPMLIYNVKFDIRQYMLVTIGEKLIRIWLYKDCYLKLSGQEFNLDDLNESIHLTNNTVQRRYKISRNRDSRLPASNMWSLEQFKSYLNATGMGDTTWESKVFPGFKRNLIAVVMASMEETNMVPNSFELYGCDFMLDESQNPILIEINSSPDMSASTEVTARLCPQVLRDVVKVIVDLPIKPYASTGLFELIFEQNYKGYATDSKLTVSGHAMNIETYKNFKNNATNKKNPPKKNASPSLIKPTIEDQKKGVILNRESAIRRNVYYSKPNPVPRYLKLQGVKLDRSKANAKAKAK